MKYFQHIAILFVAFLLMATVQIVSAATFTVTNINDDGLGSLRRAIYDSNSNNENDTIVFDQTLFNTPQIITLTTCDLVIASDNGSGTTKTLSIVGPGADLLTISGNNQCRVFTLEQVQATISGVTISGGNGLGGSAFSGSGGGILVHGGLSEVDAINFRLIDSIISDNAAANGSGGGIYIIGAKVIILNSSIFNNTSFGSGGGIALELTNLLQVYNSTVSGNTAKFQGGGIYNSDNNSSTSLTNCTIAFNHVTEGFGGGVFAGRYFKLRNTIVADNTGPSLGKDVFGNTNSQGYNLFGDAGNISIYGDTTGNQYNVNPQLDVRLQKNGGKIPTHALFINSPAIDAGNNCVLNDIPSGGCSEVALTTDQRGVSRPQDGNSDGTATIDIGSFEVSTAEIAAVPNAPDLRAGSDTGASNTDNITNSRNLTFDLGGLTVGATVEIFRNGNLINSVTAAANSISFSDNNLPADGTFVYSARQVINNTPSLQNAVTVIIDNTAPTVTINQAATQAGITRNQPINFTVVFSESLPDFDASDVSLSDSTAGVSAATIVVTGSGTTYNVAVSNITADGDVRASVLPNAVRDLAGNGSAVSTSTDNSVTFDTTPPTVTINQAATQTDPTRNSTVNFTVVFSEIVNGFSSVSVSLAGSTANVSSANVVITGNGTTYNIAVNNVSSNGGFVRASIFPSAAIDLASNPNVPSTSTDNTVTVDNISPTVTINQAVGQADPTGALPVNYTVSFSEPVTGFDSADVSLTGSTFATSGAVITVTGSGATYNVAVSNISSNGGLLRATVRSGAASDALGNSSFSSTSTDNSISIDNVSPNVSINQAIGQSDPSTTQPVNFTVVFSELVTGLTAADISLAGSTANVSNAVVAVSGSGNVYTIAVSNITSSGLVRASVIAGAAQDNVGNPSTASTSSDNTITVNVARSGFFDFDGDGKADISVFRPDNGAWYLNQSRDGFIGVTFGFSTDKLVPADYDGDGKTDVAVYRGGTWYLNRSTQGFYGVAFGDSNDIPVPADYDGDGKADIAVFRPSNGTWYVQGSTSGFYGIQFGQTGDKPIPADYDGDGKTDIAVNRSGTWYIQRSQLGFYGIQFGDSNDKLVPADYDGDGKADVAVFRPSNGTWYLQQSTNGFTGIAFGLGTDTPVAADYDGDGRADVAVYRNGTWYLNRSTQGFFGVAFGASTDQPLPNVFVR